MARQIDVVGISIAMAHVGASVNVVPAGPDRQALDELHDALSVNQAAFRARMDPLGLIANGLVAENAAPAIANAARALAASRGRPQIQLTQILRVPRPPRRRQLGGFLGIVYGCAIDDQGDHVATAGEDGAVRLWDRRAERELRAVRAGDIARSCAISGDGGLLVGGYSDGSIAVWLDADEPVLVHRAGDSALGVAVSSTDVVVAASLDGVLRAWQIERSAGSYRLLWSIDLGVPLYCCAVADSEMAIAGDKKGVLHIVSAAGTIHIQAHLGVVRACDLHPDGSLAITGSYDHSLAVWDLTTHTRRATLKGHHSAVLGCSLAANARLAVSAGLDGTSRIWDPYHGVEIGVWAPHDDHVTCCDIDRGGARIVTGSEDRTARWWPVPAEQSTLLTENRHLHQGEITRCALADSGQTLITTSTDLSVRRWLTNDLTAPSEVLLQHTSPILALATSADASVILVGDGNGELLLGHAGLWEALPATGSLITSCALSARGDIALVGDDNGGLAIWQFGAVPRRIALPSPHEDWILHCAVDAAGAVGISAAVGEDSDVCVWDLCNGNLVRVSLVDGVIGACSLSPGGQFVTTARVDGRVTIEGRADGVLISEHHESSDRILTAAAGSDGSRCLTVTRSGRLSHWTNGQLDTSVQSPPPSGLTVGGDLEHLVIGQATGDIAIYRIVVPNLDH